MRVENPYSSLEYGDHRMTGVNLAIYGPGEPAASVRCRNSGSSTHAATGGGKRVEE